MHSDDVARMLRQGIREGVLQPGQPLVQEELASRFKVSRAPIREALRALISEGLLKPRPGGGAAVTSLSASEVAELWDLRLAIEPTLASAIVENARAADLKRWKGMVLAMEQQGGDADSWARTNYTFHCDMYGIANRPHTERLLLSLYNFMLPYDKLYLIEFSRYKDLDDDHRMIIQSIEDRDEALLAQLLVSHFTPLRRDLAEKLAPAKPDASDNLETLRGLTGSP